MNVYWLEKNDGNVPSKDDWLGPHELARLDVLSVPKRRNEWRLGRWTAKAAVAAYLKLSMEAGALADIEIRPEPSGAPQTFISGRLADVTVSISHSTGTAICALAAAGIRLGCDLELIEPRSDAFLEDYFTKEEQAQVAQMPLLDRPRLITLLWSGKESALKAMKQGLRVDTRSVVVRPVQPQIGSRWTRFEAGSNGGDSFFGWCYEATGRLRTVVSDFPCGEPVLLQIAHPLTSGASPTPAQDPRCTNFYTRGVPPVTSACRH